ncbi:hypothetical protein [Sphingobium tyrosinilyticum]|uniref:Uncharacterized protein n=1 Tax=Sphingobium tyrosinilyticum TaxID=2715436 RepID=A0ABV9EZD0_9SPHN
MNALKEITASHDAGQADPLRSYLCAGGRILIAPNGVAEVSIDGAAILAGSMEQALAHQRYLACQQFVRRFRRKRGAQFAARAARMLGASTSNGWRVLAGA